MKNVEKTILKMVKGKKHLDENYVGKLNFTEDLIAVDSELDTIKDNLAFYEDLSDVNKKFIQRLGDKMMLEVMSTEGLITNENMDLFKYFSRIIGLKNVYKFQEKYKLKIEWNHRHVNRATILLALVKEIKAGKTFCIGDCLYGDDTSFKVSEDKWIEWCMLKMEGKLKKVCDLNDGGIVVKVDLDSVLKLLKPRTMQF